MSDQTHENGEGYSDGLEPSAAATTTTGPTQGQKGITAVAMAAVFVRTELNVLLGWDPATKHKMIRICSAPTLVGLELALSRAVNGYNGGQAVSRARTACIDSLLSAGLTSEEAESVLASASHSFNGAMAYYLA